MVFFREVQLTAGLLALGTGAFAAPFEWKAVDLPLGAEAPVSAVYQDRLLILGGIRGGEPSDRIWSSLDGRNWTRHQSVLPVAVTTGSAVEFEDSLFLFPTGGGETPVLVSTTGVNWETVTPSPPFGEADWRQATVHGNEIWVLSGKEGEPVEARRSQNGEDWIIVDTEGLGSIDHAHSLESYNGQLILFHPEFDGYPGLGPPVDRVVTSESSNGVDWSSRVQELYLEYDSSIGDFRVYHRTFDLATTVWNGKLWILERGAVHAHPSLADTMILLSTTDVRNWTRMRPTSDGIPSHRIKALLHPLGGGLMAGSTHERAPNSLRKWTHDPDSGPLLGEWEITFQDPRFDDLSGSEIFHHANRLWKAGANGLLSTADNVVWENHSTGHTYPDAQIAKLGDDVYIILPNGRTYRLEVITNPFHAEVTEVKQGIANTSLAAHDGWLYRLDYETIESETVICGWTIPYIYYGGNIVTSVSDNRVFQSLDGLNWTNAPDNPFPGRGTIYTSFDGSLWGVGGTLIDQQVGVPQCGVGGYDNNRFRREIRRMTGDGSWVQEGTIPESIHRVVNSIHVHGDTAYMIADDLKVFSSTNMIDWTLLGDNHINIVVHHSSVVFGPNQALLFLHSPGSAYTHPRVLASQLFDDEAEFVFPGSSPQWNLTSVFDTVEAFSQVASGRLLLTVPRVDDLGHAYLAGPLVQPLAPGGTARPGDGIPVPVEGGATDGDRFLRMEINAQAMVGQPWFRLRGNSRGFQRASEVKITTLGGERAVFNKDMGTYSAILNYQPGDTHVMPFVDLLTNRRDNSAGTLGLESVRITEWTPPAAEDLELVREYTFPWETRGFTARDIDVLIPPVAMYHDGRGLVIRGADTPRADGIVYGSWGHESDVTIQGGALYKFTWRVGSDTPADRAAEMPIVRLRVNESRFRAAPMLTVVSRNNGRLPLDNETEEYVLWFEAPEQLDGDQFIFSFDLLWTTNEITRRLDHEIWLENLRVDVHHPGE